MDQWQSRQRDLLSALAQADEREPGHRFIYAPIMGIKTAVQHPGLPSGRMTMYNEDVEMLAARGHIEFLEGKTYFILTPKRPPR
jgi:hypothetical protein